jgi:hypothetical protein
MRQTTFAGPVGPMTFGQILDRTYRLTRANLRLFVAIAAVPVGVFIVILAAMEAAFFLPIIRQFPKPPAPESIAHLFNLAVVVPSFVLFTVLQGTIFALYLAAAIHAATQANRGFATSFRDAYAVAWSRAGRYLGLLFLIYLLTFLPALVIELAMVGGFGLLAHWKPDQDPAALFLLIPLGMLLFLAAFVYGALMGLRLSLAFPASVVEGLPARAALKRSGHLTQGAKGRIFLVLLVVYAVLYALVMVFEFAAMFLAAIGFLAASALQIHLAPPWSYIAIGFAALCAFAAFFLYTALSWASLTSALAVLYHDQRLRIDGPLPSPLQPGEPA